MKLNDCGRADSQLICDLGADKNHFVFERVNRGKRSDIDRFVGIHFQGPSFQKGIDIKNRIIRSGHNAHRVWGGVVISFLQNYPPLQIGHQMVNERKFFHPLLFFLPIAGRFPWHDPAVPLGVNYVVPEFFLKSLHEYDHHNHHINPQSHTNDCKQREK